MTHPLPRRAFLASTFALAIPRLRAAPALTEGGFALISDVHQDVMHDGVERITAFVNAATEARADWVMQLGDFCVPVPGNQAFLDAWNRFAGPRYHVLGNHDTDGGHAPAKTRTFWGMEKAYYSFASHGLRFVVLDGNEPGGKAKGYRRFIAPRQREWLAAELAASREPVLVVVHQSLAEPSGVENGAEVRAILEAENTRAGGRKVFACLNGHHHVDASEEIQGITYLHVNSASYYWMGARKAESYAPDIHARHASLASVAPYRDPIWLLARVDAQAGRLILQGRASTWVGADPWQRGATEKELPRERVVPQTRDRFVEVGPA